MSTHSSRIPPVRERFKLLRFVLALVFACACLALLDRLAGPLISLGAAVEAFVPAPAVQPGSYQPLQGPAAPAAEPLTRQLQA